MVLAKAIGAERAAAIEAAPDSVADSEKFQKWNAKARNRTILQLVGAVVVGSTIIAPQLGYTSGRQLLRYRSDIAFVVSLGSYPILYKINARLAGWTAQDQNEFTYARNIRMLRNVQIQH